MKKILPFLFISLLLFAGCGQEKEMRGQIVQCFSEQNEKPVSFLLQNSEQEKVGFAVNEQTIIHWLIAEAEDIDFKQNLPENVFVSVSYDNAPQSVTINKEEIAVYEADFIIIEQILSDEITLADGSAIYVWQGLDERRCKTKDGQEILVEYRPENYEYLLQDSALKEESKNAILNYYEDQGTYYNIADELEKAYAAYQKSENGFDAYTVSQMTDKVAESQEIIYFTTNIHLPLSGSEGTEMHLGEAFDRNGKLIDNWDLFSCGKEEALQVIFSAAQIPGEEQEEMKNAIKSEYLLFYPDHMEIAFPKGTLPSQEHSFSIILEYSENIVEILHPWAMPKSQ